MNSVEVSSKFRTRFDNTRLYISEVIKVSDNEKATDGLFNPNLDDL